MCFILAGALHPYYLILIFDPSGTISKDSVNKQVLDKLQVERERGITVKAQTASLFYDYEGETYLLNLVDTPVSANKFPHLNSPLNL